MFSSTTLSSTPLEALVRVCWHRVFLYSLDGGLKGVGQINPHTFHLGEFSNSLQAHLPAVAILFIATAGRSIRDRTVGIDPYGASLQPPGGAMGSLNIIGPDARCQAVSCLVRQGNQLLLLVKLQPPSTGPKTSS
jgi:hypothetical protein